ncbi:MAG: hypothetical protein VST68_02415 [Nitrospirota bacterium]|nr:hypothetical protein [Nitrospirota bacterium]
MEIHFFFSNTRWQLCLAMVLSLIGLTGCPSTPLPKPEPIFTPTYSQEELLAALQAKEEAIVTLKGLFQAEIRGEGIPFAQSINGTVMYHRPNSLRLKGFSRFGNVLFDFLLKQNHFALRVEGEEVVYSGRISEFEEAKGAHLPIQLSFRALAVILGKVQLSDAEHVRFLENPDEYQFHVVPMHAKPGSRALWTQQIHVDRRFIQVNQMDYIMQDGQVAVSILASDFRRVLDASPVQTQTLLLPYSVKAENHNEKGKVSMKFLEMLANGPLAPTAFSFSKF